MRESWTPGKEDWLISWSNLRQVHGNHCRKPTPRLSGFKVLKFTATIKSALVRVS
jgi:hypothetical protein